MAKQVMALSTVLLKLQAAYGTMETTLTTTDFIQLIQPSLEFEPVVSPVEMVGAGFSNNASVIGPQEASLKGGMPFRTGGGSLAGQLGKALQILGFKETAAAPAFTYAQTDIQSEWKDATAWMYSGNLSSSGAYLRKAGNMMANGKITLDFEKDFATLDLEAKGYFDAAEAAGTQPTCTRSAIVTAALKAATISILGDTDFIPLNMVIDIGNDVVSTINPKNASGKGHTVIANRKITMTAKVYRDTDVTPMTALLAGNTGAVSVVWGTAPNKFTITLTSIQLNKVGVSDQNSIETYDLTADVLNNAMSIVMDTTA